MKVGDLLHRVMTTESVFGFKYESRRTQLPCRVIWIHPEGRFYTVEFTLERGERLRECFYPERKKEYIRRNEL